jgi:4-carboxymuconolactone decarboxylase
VARVPYLSREELAESDRAVFDRIEKSRGGVGNIWRAMLNSPNVADKMLALADELRHGVGIAKNFRELAVLVVGKATKCDYEFDHHWNAALKAGVPREKLEAIESMTFETSPLFTDVEKAVMSFAREATEVGTVKDATWDALKRHFDTRAAMEILYTVAWYNTVVRILLPLDIQNEPGFKRL